MMLNPKYGSLVFFMWRCPLLFSWMLQFLFAQPHGAINAVSC